jgi:ubiquinone/menaquinone biosynthesis C-methylase UbiE
MDTKQKDFFLKEEADAWFDRNIDVINKFEIDHDPVASIINKYQISFYDCLEVGCSAGHRLNGLSTLYPESNYYGIDPSSKAVNFGKKRYAKINLSIGTVDNLIIYDDEKFDIIIVGFLFYVLDRKLLLKAISEIDRVLKNDGFLILVDFHSIKPVRVKYHHIKNFDAYSYKQPYEKVFTGSNLYHLLEMNTIIHDGSYNFDSTSDFMNQYSVSLLKKNIHIAYE